jgi:outer membrane protein insertion porin family
LFFAFFKTLKIRKLAANIKIWTCIVTAIFVLNACNVTRSLQEGETLLVKNSIQIDQKIPKRRLLRENMSALPQQKPNRKMFGLFPVRLAIYTQANSKKENKFRWWLKNKVGEAPVVFKKESVDRTKTSLSNLMFNRGYLHNQVNTEIFANGKKIHVVYTITPNDRFTIAEVVFPEPVDLLHRTILETKENTLLIKGDPFDINVMDNERKRISDFLRDYGYFYFNREYIAFDIDSNQADKTVKLIMRVREPRNPNDFKKFAINNIYTLTNYRIDGGQQNVKNDTIQVGEYKFIADEFKFKPKVLINAIHFSRGEYFKMSDQQKTLRRLSSYGTFKFTDIEFKDLSAQKGKEELDVFIYLTPSKKQSMSVEVEANHSFQGFTGSALSYVYRNKNLTKAADLLEFRASGGVEFEFRNQLSMLRNADIIGEVNYFLNKFVVPFPLKNVSKNNNVRTRFSLRYNYGRRIPFYTLHSNTFTFGYEWNETISKRHVYNPIAINLFLIPKKEDAFIERLENIRSLARSFEEVIVAGSNYTYLLSTRKSDRDRNWMFFRGDVRMSGNLVHAMSLLANINKDNEKPYKIGNVIYSQFFRLEGDIVHYFKFAPHATLVNRFNAGTITSYGNTLIAPYFQQFYAGGPNSIRGFRLRALGPGNYADIDNIDNPNFFFDQAGDIKLETNAELRFDIYKWFKGAVFLDAGNVWLMRKDEDRPTGEFRINTFHKAIALGTGFGVRLDFDYFVIRTDIGIPIRDPRLFSTGDEWVIKNFDLGDKNWRRNNLIFNLAIGYPF